MLGERGTRSGGERRELVVCGADDALCRDRRRLSQTGGVLGGLAAEGLTQLGVVSEKDGPAGRRGRLRTLYA